MSRRARRKTFPFFWRFQLSPLEDCLRILSIAIGHDLEVRRKRIDCLGANAVETHAELEHIVIVFRARVDQGNTFNHLPERDTPPEISNGDLILLDSDIDLFSLTHDEFIYGVVNNLLQHHVNAVVWIIARSEATDVHPGPSAGCAPGN